MSKDITDGILLKAGMYKVGNAAMEYIVQVDGQKYAIQIVKYSNRNGRNYSCGVFNEHDLPVGFACVQTIDHFNKLMKMLDINFRLKEE